MRPTNVHEAKMLYRAAVYLRLKKQVESKRKALMYVNRALELVPGDVAILRERDTIRTWIGGES